MISVKNLFDNDDVKIIERKGNISVVEFQRDVSVNKLTAMSEYFAAKMNVRRRQVVIQLQGDEYVTSAGAMQWMAGNIESKTNVKGVGDLFSKAVRGKVTGESAIKPEYTGDGQIVLEPTYRHIILINLEEWNNSIVLDDGLFLACESKLQQKAVMRSNISSAVAGNEVLFNLGVQ